MGAEGLEGDLDAGMGLSPCPAVAAVVSLFQRLPGCGRAAGAEERSLCSGSWSPNALQQLEWSRAGTTSAVSSLRTICEPKAMRTITSQRKKSPGERLEKAVGEAWSQAESEKRGSLS